MTEIQRVEITFQDHCLVIVHLQADRIKELFDLAGEGLFIGQKEILGKLLSDRGSALQDRIGEQVVFGSSGHPDRIETEMKIKAFVFNGDKCILYLLRNLIEGDPLTVFAEVAFIEDIAVFVIQRDVLPLFIQRQRSTERICINKEKEGERDKKQPQRYAEQFFHGLLLSFAPGRNRNIHGFIVRRIPGFKRMALPCEKRRIAPEKPKSTDAQKREGNYP